jgi:hypothetical protein
MAFVNDDGDRVVVVGRLTDGTGWAMSRGKVEIDRMLNRDHASRAAALASAGGRLRVCPRVEPVRQEVVWSRAACRHTGPGSRPVRPHDVGVLVDQTTMEIAHEEGVGGCRCLRVGDPRAE